MASQARLIIEGRSNWVYTHFIGEAEVTTIGRGSENDIDTKDVNSSTRHAEIIRRDGRYIIKDLGSRNGTIVNGARVDEQRLKNNDAIQIGQINMSFLTDEDESFSAIAISEASLHPPENALDAVQSALKEIQEKPALEESTTSDSAELRDALGELQKSLQQARNDVRRLRTVNEFMLAIAGSPSQQLLLERAMDFMSETVKAENGFIMLVDPTSGKWGIRAAFGEIGEWRKAPAEEKKEHVPLSLTVVKQVVNEGGPVFSESAQLDERFDEAGSVMLLQIQTLMCIPILIGGKAKGACYVDRRTNRMPFGKEDQEIFNTMVEQLGLLMHAE